MNSLANSSTVEVVAKEARGRRIFLSHDILQSPSTLTTTFSQTTILYKTEFTAQLDDLSGGEGSKERVWSFLSHRRTNEPTTDKEWTLISIAVIFN